MNTERFFVVPFPPPGDQVVAPRYLDTVRRSIDGTKCLVAFQRDQIPASLKGEGMSTEECRTLIAGNPEWEYPSDI